MTTSPSFRSGDAHEFDLVILGAGSGGYACALRARQLGLSVAMVEEDKVGGTCLHRGCIPTKALLHAAEVADHARHGADLGVRSTFDGIDVDALHGRKQAVVDQLHRGLGGLVSGAGIEVVNGTGRVRDAHTVEVETADGTRTVTGAHLVLATGSRARTIDSFPEHPRIVTSDGALALGEIPSSAIVLGGGVIGVEFASLLTSFGTEVTVVEALDRLLPLEEESIAAGLSRAFRKRGIAVRTGVSVAAVTADDAGVTATLDGGEELRADLLLVAVGRAPRSEGLGLENLGVETDRGFVVTDDRCRTSVEGVRAVGDLVPGLQLAHRGFAHGIFVAEDIAGLEPSPVLDREIPKVTYSDPEVASVGVTSAAAQEAGLTVESVSYPLGGNGRSLIKGTSGSVVVVREVDGPVVGVHMVGQGVSEIISEAQLIVGWQAHPDDIVPFVHAHPTQGEALGEAAMLAAGRPLHAHA